MSTSSRHPIAHKLVLHRLVRRELQCVWTLRSHEGLGAVRWSSQADCLLDAI